MSRLDYAPTLKEIKVTDIKKGIGVFTPKPDKPVSFAALKETLKKAGYTLDSANITVVGTLTREDKKAFLVVASSGQRFFLEGANLEQTLGGVNVGNSIEITGDWKTVGEERSSREVITVRAAQTVNTGSAAKAVVFRFEQASPLRFAQAKFIISEPERPESPTGTELAASPKTSCADSCHLARIDRLQRRRGDATSLFHQAAPGEPRGQSPGV